ncbi:MAG: hypothetical protein ACOYMG_28240, partial [Candidatus Methylumidiphilus sp.]
RQVTVHGLDTGIHAGMTAVLAWQDLCITMSAERGNDQSGGVANPAALRARLFAPDLMNCRATMKPLPDLRYLSGEASESLCKLDAFETFLSLTRHVRQKERPDPILSRQLGGGSRILQESLRLFGVMPGG